MRINWLADALRAQPGLKVREVSGWKTRGRESSFSPRSVMFHHTASSRSGGSAPALGIVTHGRSDLPGPLCHVLVGRDGTAYVVASGRANHAGTGGPWRDIPANQGNTYMVGVEVENDGVGEPWSPTVLAACDRVFAAILKRLNRDASWLVGHKEYTSRKIDPNGVNMNAYRSRLATYMKGGDPLAYLSEQQQKFLANFADQGMKNFNAGGGMATWLFRARNFIENARGALGARNHGGAGTRVGDAARAVEDGGAAPPSGPHKHVLADVPHEHDGGDDPYHVHTCHGVTGPAERPEEG